jgi:hypothetical protein
MKENKVIDGGFEWIPPDKRTSRFGGTVPPRKPDTRLPVLWLARDGGELYLVNSSQDTLDFVIADSGGFQTVDDGVSMASAEKGYEYRDLKPNEAAKVEEYDGYYDLDYLLQVSLRVQSKSLGCLEIRSPPEKGGIGETVLLWDNGEVGKYVFLEKCKQE